MNLNLKAAITAVGSVAIVGAAVTNYVKVHHIEKAKRANIKTNMVLDTRAIELARDMMTKKIQDGSYPIGSLVQLQNDMQTEIEFQKIALREEF